MTIIHKTLALATLALALSACAPEQPASRPLTYSDIAEGRVRLAPRNPLPPAPPAEARPEPPEAEAEPATAIAEAGTYLVGADIQPGTYRHAGSEEFCQAWRYSDANTSVWGVTVEGQTFVEVLPGDWAVKVDCGGWALTG